jgi:hypothetical protein
MLARVVLVALCILQSAHHSTVYRTYPRIASNLNPGGQAAEFREYIARSRVGVTQRLSARRKLPPLTVGMYLHPVSIATNCDASKAAAASTPRGCGSCNIIDTVGSDITTTAPELRAAVCGAEAPAVCLYGQERLRRRRHLHHGVQRRQRFHHCRWCAGVLLCQAAAADDAFANCW